VTDANPTDIRGVGCTESFAQCNSLAIAHSISHLASQSQSYSHSTSGDFHEIGKQSINQSGEDEGATNSRVFAYLRAPLPLPGVAFVLSYRKVLLLLQECASNLIENIRFFDAVVCRGGSVRVALQLELIS
jgi:hypothetical protein